MLSFHDRKPYSTYKFAEMSRQSASFYKKTISIMMSYYYHVMTTMNILSKTVMVTSSITLLGYVRQVEAGQ